MFEEIKKALTDALEALKGEEEEEPPEDPHQAALAGERKALSEANERLRDTAKWVIGVFGAVAVVLAAGLSFTSFGSLDLDTTSGLVRAGFALVGALIAIGGILVAIWAAYQVQPKEVISLPAAAASAPAKAWIDQTDILPSGMTLDGFPARHKQAAADKHQAEKALRALKKTPNPSDEAIARAEADLADKTDTYDELDQVGVRILQHAQFAIVHDAFRRFTTRWLFIGAGLAAAGVVVFGIATNPPKDEPPTISLRSAVFGGDAPRLTDGKLAGIDLTGADLTGANLLGTDLSDAVIKDVAWDGATCPDGAVVGDGDEEVESCAGHLSPG